MRAPALAGRRWAGGDGDLPLPLRLSGVGAPLRGRVVVLHFFTAGCVSCVHAHDELQELVTAHPDVVLLGVHSPKFPHEATRAGLDAALARADLGHLVLDDADHETWSAYAAGAWPTIVVVDAGGYVAQTFVGEGHLAEMTALVGELLDDSGAAPAAAARPARRPGAAPPRGPASALGAVPAFDPALSSPSAGLVLPDGRVVVADAGHHRLVVRGAGSGADPDAQPVAVVPGMSAPAGMALLPPDVAARVGWDLAVADPGAHRVLGVSLADGSVRTVAGTGEPLRPDAPQHERGGRALSSALSSPMALAWSAGVLVVAMSGVHQLWALRLATDPADARLSVIAGSGAEGLLDGVGGGAMLAQPSALAACDAVTGSGGDGVWFVDAESSSLRRARPPVSGAADAVGGAAGGEAWEVTTVVGTGVYAFGHADGPVGSASMQHPLGVTLAPDGSVLVADTYNGAVRRVDVEAGREATVTTVVDGLAEPVAVVPLVRAGEAGEAGEGAGPAGPGGSLPAAGDHELLVVESAAHRLSTLTLGAARVLLAGAVDVTVRVAAPAGQHLDGADGPPVRITVSSSAPLLLDEGGPARSADGVTWTASTTLAAGSGVLAVTAVALTCDDDGPGLTGGACRRHQRSWRVPVDVRADAGRAPRVVDLDVRLDDGHP